jgi:hypothetical protein
MTGIDAVAAVITVVLYMSVYAATWQDRYLARLVLGSTLAGILAVVI